MALHKMNYSVLFHPVASFTQKYPKEKERLTRLNHNYSVVMYSIGIPIFQAGLQDIVELPRVGIDYDLVDA